MCSQHLGEVEHWLPGPVGFKEMLFSYLFRTTTSMQSLWVMAWGMLLTFLVHCRRCTGCWNKVFLPLNDAHTYSIQTVNRLDKLRRPEGSYSGLQSLWECPDRYFSGKVIHMISLIWYLLLENPGTLLFYSLCLYAFWDLQGTVLDNVVVPVAKLYGVEQEYEYLKPSIKNFPQGASWIMELPQNVQRENWKQ